MFINKDYVDIRINAIKAKFINLRDKIKKLQITKCNNDDERLSDTRDPNAHTHTRSHITNFAHNHNYEPPITKNSAFNKNFGSGNDEVARGNHTHSSSSPFSVIKTTNGSNNQTNFPQAPYPGGDVPDGWQYVGVIKTDQIHAGTGKPIYVGAYVWSNGQEPLS